jgi:hypothetical protein
MIDQPGPRRNPWKTACLGGLAAIPVIFAVFFSLSAVLPASKDSHDMLGNAMEVLALLSAAIAKIGAIGWLVTWLLRRRR